MLFDTNPSDAGILFTSDPNPYLGAIVPHAANVQQPVGGGGYHTMGSGGQVPGQPPGYVPAGISVAQSFRKPIGRTTKTRKGKAVETRWQPSAQGARISVGGAVTPLTETAPFPAGGLFGLSGLGAATPGQMVASSSRYAASENYPADGMGGFFGDVGNFFKKAVRYTGAIVVAPFAPARFTAKTFGLSSRESRQFETYAKTARMTAVTVAGSMAIRAGYAAARGALATRAAGGVSPQAFAEGAATFTPGSQAAKTYATSMATQAQYATTAYGAGSTAAISASQAATVAAQNAFVVGQAGAGALAASAQPQNLIQTGQSTLQPGWGVTPQSAPVFMPAPSPVPTPLWKSIGETALVTTGVSMGLKALQGAAGTPGADNTPSYGATGGAGTSAPPIIITGGGGYQAPAGGSGGEEAQIQMSSKSPYTIPAILAGLGFIGYIVLKHPNKGIKK